MVKNTAHLLFETKLLLLKVNPAGVCIQAVPKILA
jgi:hypothetical protein